MGSSLGQQPLSEGAKLPELKGGRFGLSPLLHSSLSQLIYLVMHLLKDFGMASICGSVDCGKEGGNLLLSGSAVLLDLGDGGIHAGDGLLGRFLLLAHADGGVCDLLLKGTGHLVQGDELVARVVLNAALSADRLLALVAVGVDLEPNVLLATRNALGGGSSRKSILQINLLVNKGCFTPLVPSGASRAVILVAINEFPCKAP